MKKMFLPIMAFFLMIGMSAFTTTPDHVSKKHTLYYWFDLSGTYINHSASIPSGCSSGGNNCAFGYENVDDPSHPTQPTGHVDFTAKKP